MASNENASVEVDSDPKISDMGEKRKRVNFKWTKEMHSESIECLKQYKVQCEFRSIDFDADKARQFEWLRKEMSKEHDEDDQSCFGPVALADRPPNCLDEEEAKDYERQVKEEKRKISRGYNRVLEKVKTIRQGFSKAVIAGKRSGSGKLVYDHYDSLKEIWGGSPNTEPLACGINSSTVKDSSDESSVLSQQDEVSVSDDLDNDVDDEVPKSVVPKLIDNKRKHMERNLSARQRDALLLDEAKEDKAFRKDLTDALKDSTKCIAEGFQAFTQAMTQMGAVLGRSLESMAQTPNMALPAQINPMRANQIGKGNYHIYPQMFKMPNRNMSMPQAQHNYNYNNGSGCTHE